MPTDQQVSAKAVLGAVMELRRQGPGQVFRQLEQLEPDLIDYLLETLTDLHQQLLALGGPPKLSRRLYRDIQALVLVCISALRRGHYELWRQSDAGGQLEEAEHDEPSAPPPDKKPDAGT